MTNFYPDIPKRFNRIHWIMKQTGWIPKPWYWKAGTIVEFEDKGPGINRYCKDVSKSNVDRVFKEVFGYSSLVDPIGKGKAVIKSERNAAHDGRIVELPYKLKDGEVCQRFIDTKQNGKHVEYRALIVMGKCVGFLKKTKPNTFNSTGCKMEFLPDSEESLLLQIWHGHRIKEFCKGISMDYGELDILFDKDTPYIVDANPCPGGVGKAFLNQSKQELNHFIQCHRPLFQ